MIYIGLTGWGDHYSLYPSSVKASDKLPLYSGYFPIVEVDSSFYAVQPKRNFEKWVKETPDSFRFVIKAYQGMTGHDRNENPFENKEEMFDAFLESLQPVLEVGKLQMVLFQFPPWFDCKKENVEMLRYIRSKYKGLPLALEFRHQSWFHPKFKERTLAFMKEENWIHSVCDEPQAGVGSIPTVLEATNKEMTLVRLHGRNVHGWNKQGRSRNDWREVRYLYRYSTAELKEWAANLKALEKQSKDVYVLFNNNSGGDAADNAKEMIELLGLDYDDLSPRQLGLF
ncbi:DUF72 domain-containing protein [Bacillus taeanensis]|uniref:DUF72 domain-containing protein n=1 Tax=Bacillus taeanensis TaxID=273032 RepID=A0A366Y4D2_9BACI|nr:DUF72 domain-containing protein [Bacillus taeanensis]RBW71273.1 DUF72 domain-containing protein [Bacillus taeanensis]